MHFVLFNVPNHGQLATENGRTAYAVGHSVQSLLCHIEI